MMAPESRPRKFIYRKDIMLEPADVRETMKAADALSEPFWSRGTLLSPSQIAEAKSVLLAFIGIPLKPPFAVESHRRLREAVNA